MKTAKGFTLVELLVVVAIIGIIAAIAVPGLLRARVSANESATIADLRSMTTAETAYNSANGGSYGPINCLSTPSNCIVGYAGPAFLDAGMAVVSTAKTGYVRTFLNGPSVASSASVAAGSIADFTYIAVPISSQSGTRAFAVDSRGRICFALGLTAPSLSGTCNSIQ